MNDKNEALVLGMVAGVIVEGIFFALHPNLGYGLMLVVFLGFVLKTAI